MAHLIHRVYPIPEHGFTIHFMVQLIQLKEQDLVVVQHLLVMVLVDLVLELIDVQ